MSHLDHLMISKVLTVNRMSEKTRTQSVLVLLVLQGLKSVIVHELLIQFLELCEGVSVVLSSSLGENVDTEVGLLDVVIVLGLILWSHGVVLSSHVVVLQLELLLLFVKSLGDDVCS